MVYQYIWGSVSVPRNVWERRCGMDDQYTISYFDDDDFILSLKGKGYQMRTSNRVVLTIHIRTHIRINAR